MSVIFQDFQIRRRFQLNMYAKLVLVCSYATCMIALPQAQTQFIQDCQSRANQFAAGVLSQQSLVKSYYLANAKFVSNLFSGHADGMLMNADAIGDYWSHVHLKTFKITVKEARLTEEGLLLEDSAFELATVDNSALVSGVRVVLWRHSNETWLIEEEIWTDMKNCKRASDGTITCESPK